MLAAVGAAGCIALLASCSAPGEAVRSGPLSVKETCGEIGRLMSVPLDVANQVLVGEAQESDVREAGREFSVALADLAADAESGFVADLLAAAAAIEDGDLETSREFAALFDALSQRCDDARARIEFNLSHGG